MRHSAILKALLSLLLLLAACAWADETAGRAAISRTIAAANQFPPRADLFTADADASSAYDQLWQGKHLSFGIPPGGEAAAAPSSDRPTVVISHEPWGEASIDFPGRWPHAVMDVVNPRIASRTIRFVTADVALVEGACVYQEEIGGRTQFTPLLFVMKRDGADWKIASLRVLASR